MEVDFGGIRDRPEHLFRLLAEMSAAQNIREKEQWDRADGTINELAQDATVVGTTVAMVRTATAMAAVWHEATMVAAITWKVIGGEETAAAGDLDKGSGSRWQG